MGGPELLHRQNHPSFFFPLVQFDYFFLFLDGAIAFCDRVCYHEVTKVQNIV